MIRWSVILVLAACGSSATTSEPTAPPKLHQRGSCPPERDDGAYHVALADRDLRRGALATKFSSTPTSPTTPIQLFGLRSELEWLVKVTCDDGSRPWGRDLDKAHGARQGGHVPEIKDLCTKPTDLYIAPCPEREYWIYLDIYHCAPGEVLYRDVKLTDRKTS